MGTPCLWCRRLSRRRISNVFATIFVARRLGPVSGVLRFGCYTRSLELAFGLNEIRVRFGLRFFCRGWIRSIRVGRFIRRGLSLGAEEGAKICQSVFCHSACETSACLRQGSLQYVLNQSSTRSYVARCSGSARSKWMRTFASMLSINPPRLQFDEPTTRRACPFGSESKR